MIRGIGQCSGRGTLFISMAGLVLAQVLDPVIAQQIVGRIMEMGM